MVGPTRGSWAIDCIFVNISRSVKAAGTLDPLEMEEIDGVVSKSDHRVAYCRLQLERREAFKWETYQYRVFNDSSVNFF